MVRPPPPIKNPGYAYGLAAIFFVKMSFRISCSVLGNDCPYKAVTNFTQDAVTIFKDADSSPVHHYYYYYHYWCLLQAKRPYHSTKIHTQEKTKKQTHKQHTLNKRSYHIRQQVVLC